MTGAGAQAPGFAVSFAPTLPEPEMVGLGVAVSVFGGSGTSRAASAVSTATPAAVPVSREEWIVLVVMPAQKTTSSIGAPMMLRSVRGPP